MRTGPVKPGRFRLCRSVGRVLDLTARQDDDFAQFCDAITLAEIAKALVLCAPRRVDREERVEHVRNLVEADALGDNLVEPRPLKIAADINRIEAGDAADDADIARVRPGTAIRAASDADRHPLLLDAPARHALDDLADHAVADPLGLGQR